MTNSKIKSPYPYFGGKRSVAPIIWKGLGNISNYVEPFFGSLSVLLANPSPAKIETVNDIDHFLVNFWRSIIDNPQEVAKYADFPVSEAELHARHQYLLTEDVTKILSNISNDPNVFDYKIAGYWIYGQCASIGNNWLHPKGLKALPLLSSAGGGIHGLKYDLEKDFVLLQKRLKRVRICCNDWSKIVAPSITYNNVGLGKNDITGVFLDPPYEFKGRDKVYKEESNVFSDTYQWAIDNGDNPKLRIVLCGYDEGLTFPDGWLEYAWENQGGMANLGNNRGRDNAKKERIWFSPNCLDISA